MPLTPKNRKEEWLQGLVDHETTLTPKNREEEWMKEIIDASGGGGGGGTGGVLVATVTVDTQAMTMTLDKTYNDIIAAPFTVVSIYDENNRSFAFVSATSKSNIGVGVYVSQIRPDGGVSMQMFSANSPDAPLVFGMGQS